MQSRSPYGQGKLALMALEEALNTSDDENEEGNLCKDSAGPSGAPGTKVFHTEFTSES